MSIKDSSVCLGAVMGEGGVVGLGKRDHCARLKTFTYLVGQVRFATSFFRIFHIGANLLNFVVRHLKNADRNLSKVRATEVKTRVVSARGVRINGVRRPALVTLARPGLHI